MPTYSIAELAGHLGLDLLNTAKALAAMERGGLQVREMASREVWDAIARNHMGRMCACYSVAETIEVDRVAARAWRDGVGERSERAFAAMVCAPPETAQPVCIDVQAREVPGIG